jgi:hypothetical protein
MKKRFYMSNRALKTASEKLTERKRERTKRLIVNDSLLDQAEKTIARKLENHRNMLKRDGITGKAADQILKQISTEMWRDYAR